MLCMAMLTWSTVRKLLDPSPCTGASQAVSLQVTSIKPDWPKGYSRLGAANMGLGRLDEAVQAYSQGKCSRSLTARLSANPPPILQLDCSLILPGTGLQLTASSAKLKPSLQAVPMLCNAGLQHDPNNAGLKSDLETAQADQARKKRGGQGLFGAQMLAKLAVNPKTSGFLQQPDFMRMMQDINNHPDHMGNYLGDPRFQMALEVGLSLGSSGC